MQDYIIFSQGKKQLQYAFLENKQHLIPINKAPQEISNS